jgi:hypothetical protein
VAVKSPRRTTSRCESARCCRRAKRSRNRSRPCRRARCRGETASGGRWPAGSLSASPWRRFFAGASERGQEAALSPLDELLARLAKIEQAGEPLERTHTALSLALRRYLGRTLDFPAAESTTSEIQRQLRGRHLPGDIAQRATRLLRDCDGIKFARGETTPAELALRLAAAREMATAIDQYLNPAPAPLQATA